MKKNNLIITPEILKGIKGSWNKKNIQLAITEFRKNAPSVPVPRLYEAYLWLKEKIDIEDAESEKQFTLFIEHFLRILEDRGAENSGIYTEVLRDSAEYQYLESLLKKNKPDQKLLLIETAENQVEQKPAVKEITLKEILLNRKSSLTGIDIIIWHKIVDAYFRNIKDEEKFVKKCLQVINNINSRTEKETYHTEILVVYAFDRIQKYNKPSLKTKGSAMQMLNLMTDKGEMWKTLHDEYLEIIKK